MAGQSFAMGEAFGKGFQYGKRRISAMTNEQFNAMDAKDHFEETTADISEMIPSMKKQMNNFSTLQTDIIKTLIEQLKDAGITIGEAVAETLVTDVGPFVEERSKTTLNTLIGIVGLPPLYSKLVSPTGIRALIKFWEDANVISGLKLALNPTLWIANEIKKIFKQAPSGSTVNTVFKWITDNIPNFIGPSIPAGGIKEPDTQPGNTIVVNPDGSITNKDTRVPIGTGGTLRAPSSIITKFNLLNQQIPAVQRLIAQSPTSWNVLNKWKPLIAKVNKQMFDLWVKYDLAGKVSTRWYSGPNALV